MVEQKSMQLEKEYRLACDAPPGQVPSFTPEQYTAFMNLHRALLYEHYDFFLASQHPSATPAVKRLTMKYGMHARLWRHGIVSFIELLRTRLPASLDYMLSFIFIAYSVIALLFETVPAFEDTWIECIGDLGPTGLPSRIISATKRYGLR
jgi:hypothetical protein